jgi:hypothetical protein
LVGNGLPEWRNAQSRNGEAARPRSGCGLHRAARLEVELLDARQLLARLGERDAVAENIPITSR